MTAVIARASAAGDSKAVELADLFCRMARRRLSQLHRNLYCNDDRRLGPLAKKILAGDFAWLEDNMVKEWEKRG